MFLRSKVQEMILKRRSRSMNGANSAQRGHVPDQLATPSTTPCDSGGGKGTATAARALFAAPRLLHSASLPAGSGKQSPAALDAESSSMSPTSVLDAAFASGSPDVVCRRRRPWHDQGLHGLADALDEQRESPSLVRSCSLDRRVEFGVKNKGSWLPASPADPGDEMEMEPSSEDYTCVICRGPKPRTVHIFGDRVVEGGAEETSPRPISNPTPARGEGAFLSL